MLSIKNDAKVVCVCRGGQVRSVSARFILADKHGMRNVLACGWEKNSRETLDMLFAWADFILIVGSSREWTTSGGPLFFVQHDRYRDKTRLIDIGPDNWGHYTHPDLVTKLTPLVEELLCVA